MRAKNHILKQSSNTRLVENRSARNIASATWCTAVAVALVVTGAFTAAAASAYTEPSFCIGDVVVDGGGVTLRNVEGWRSVGPFEADVEPGWYVVVALSKAVADDADIDSQQWNIASTDGTWQTPLTLDVPTGRGEQLTVFFDEQVVEPISSVTFEHGGGGDGLGAVEPVCVAFTSIDAPSEAAPLEATDVPETVLPDEDLEAVADDASESDPESAVDTAVEDEPRIDTEVLGAAELARTDSSVTQRTVGLTLVLMGLGGLLLQARQRAELMMIRRTQI